MDAAHIIAQVAHHEGHEVFAFTRPNDKSAQEFALRLGASWAGGSDLTAATSGNVIAVISRTKFFIRLC